MFVRKSQYQEYVYLKDIGYNIVSIPTSIQEVGKTRKYITYWCDKHHYDWFFMFDDDISKIELLAEKPDGG